MPPRKMTTNEHAGVLVDGSTANVGASIPEGVLRSVTVSLNDSQGPCLLHPEIRLESKEEKSVAFADAEWIRSDSDGPVDTFHYEGEVPVPFGASLLLNLRNDTGDSVNWRTSWAVEDG